MDELNVKSVKKLCCHINSPSQNQLSIFPIALAEPDNAVGRKATLNYIGCKLIGSIIEVILINSELNYHICFQGSHTTKSGIVKYYYWSAIYPQDYVIILN